MKPNAKHVLRRLLSLMCCMAILLPCVPATSAAGNAIFAEGFESVESDSQLSGVWTKGGTGTASVHMKLGVDRAFDGNKSFLLVDEDTKGSLWARTQVPTTGPAGTEYVLTTKYYVEEQSGSSTPYIRLQASSNSYSTTYTHSTGQWETLSSILPTETDAQTLLVVMGSNTAPTCKVYFDDLVVQELTQEVALQYTEEKLQFSAPSSEEMLSVLQSMALGLNEVDSALEPFYTRSLKKLRAEKGATLTKAEIQSCINKVNGGDVGPLFEDGFETYKSDNDLRGVWTKSGTGTDKVSLKLSVDQAFSGKNSFLMVDEDTAGSQQAKAKVPTTAPAGTEYILTTKYYVAEQSGSSTPFIRLAGTNAYTTIFTYSTEKWDSLSTILASESDGETLQIAVGSNTPPTCKVYFDDILVQQLTEELAVQYINEKAQIPTLLTDDMMPGLRAKALGLAGVNESAKVAYVEELQTAREEKGSDLTRQEIQNCIVNANMKLWADSIVDRAIYHGVAGSISADVTGMPQGVSTKWVSVSPANKNITVANGVATATAIPTGADDVYTAVLRVSGAGKSVDLEYTIKLVNASGLHAQEVEWAVRAMNRISVIGADHTGTLAAPAEVTANGVTAQWTQIKSNPNNRLKLSDGILSVNTLPSGMDYDEAVVTLKLTKGDASAQVDCRVVIYDQSCRVLVALPNSSLEAVGSDAMAEGWVAVAPPTDAAFVERTDKEARTGAYSVRVVDADPVNANSGFRSHLDAIKATANREYVTTYWAKGMATAATADRAGAAAYVEFNSDAKTRKTAYAGPATPISATEWTQVTMRGTADAPYVDAMAYSYQATVMDLYVDDFLLWEITPEGLALEIDTALKGNADTLYTLLSGKSLNISGLNADNKDAYFSTLNAKRASKGRILTAAELTAGVKEANDAVIAGNKELLTKLAGEIKTSQTVDKVGIVAVPALSDSSVSVKYTAVTGDGAGRIELTGIAAKVVSLPSNGKKDETATLAVTLSKGGTTITTNVKVTLKALSKNMSDMIVAAKELDINSYLNGQTANFVTSDLATLPASLNGSISIKWQALDSATLTASKAMTAQGKVTRPTYGEMDAAVTLRATLSKGGDKYDHDLHLIVPAEGAEDARAVITRNADFESEAPMDEYTAPDGWHKNLKWADGRNEILTSYANIAANMPYSGGQSLRITANGKMASIQNLNVTTAQEGLTYTLETMAYTDSDLTTPSVSLKFWDNEGLVIAVHTATYDSVSGGRGVWKNLSVSGVAPAGVSMVTAELDGGTTAGVTYFDDVRLREWPIVANGSFELGTNGWTTAGTVADGKLTLTAGQSAVSMVRSANRGVSYYLSLNADGGKAALRFVDKDGKTLAEYGKDLKSGLNAFFAYAPANTAGVQVVLTGAMTADNVKIVRSVTGTNVSDGDFEFSANNGTGTPWDLTDAVIAPNTGKDGAGLTVKAGGKALSTVFPVEDGKGYIFSAEVKGKDGQMTIELYNIMGALMNRRTVASEQDGWNTLSYRVDQLFEAINVSTPEHFYAQITLSGAAVFDNVKVVSTSKTVTNPSMENTKVMPYGTFPYNWTGYGKAATYVANQDGQFTEGVKGLAVELFGLGEGGIRSAMIKDVKSGRAYEATVKAKGSGAKLTIEFWDGSFNKLGSEAVTISAEEFKEYSVKGTAPSGTIYASLTVGGDGIGFVCADEATLYPVIRSIGTNLQLFLDNWFIQDIQNVKRVYHEGEKTEVMFTGGWYPAVQWDSKDQVYKMWHQVDGYNMMLRTSKDGLNWSSPVACYFDTGEPAKGNSVRIDENESDPAKRYKAIIFNHVQSRVDGSYDYYTSADGITWHYEAKGIRGQDVVTMAYDAVNDEYIVTYKISTTGAVKLGNKRTHSTIKSKDLVNWTEGVRQYTVGTVGDVVAEDMLRADGYGTGMYPLGDSYVAMNWRFLLDDADSFGGLMDSTLFFSRDLTEDWQRLYDESGALVVGIPRGTPGSWDDAQTYSADTATNIGDETWWYYAGWNGDHGSVGVPKTPAVAAMKWRRNGFASMNFGADGIMTTQQFTLMGDKLHLNAKGDLTVELLDANGAVVATGKFSGDSVDSVIIWDKSIAGQAGKVVSLRFTGSNAELYTIQWKGSIFSDVSTDAWYSTAVNYAVDNGIMGGYGGGKFGPNDTLTRAMVIQMLYNKVGQPKIDGKHGFDDVPTKEWFNNAVTWGTSNGVMGGYGNGKFGPNDNVTIEQIAVILWNYSGNPEFNAKLGNVGAYSGWAENALTWATDKGILHGVNFKNATDNATRAQAAQMLTNFLRW